MTSPLTDLEAYTDVELKEATSVIPFSPAATLLSWVLILRVGTFFMWRRSSALTNGAKRRVTVYRGYPLLNGCHACASAGFAISTGISTPRENSSVRP